MVPKRQRAKDRIEKKKKKNGAREKREVKPLSNRVSGEREAKYRKEGKESESEKKPLAVGWERRETGACRSGVGRGNQEGGAPLFSSQRCPSSPFYHLARSLFFQLLFLGDSRGESNKKDPAV